MGTRGKQRLGKVIVIRIDLHTHSTCSDGTDSPADLVRQAAAAGLAVIGLTDHDTMDGWAEAGRAARELGVLVLPGVEISARHEGRSVHLLGYLVDPVDPALLAEITRTKQSRQTRLERMVAKLTDAGLPITVGDVRSRTTPGSTPGRPHIADALVAAGVVAHRDDAFAEWLADDSPFYVRYHAPEARRAVEVVRHAGGVPVLAHPFRAGRSGGGLGEKAIEDLTDVGLAGIEAAHPDHDVDATARACSLADRLGLLVTGSSDYHGRGKRARLGEHLTDPDSFFRIRERGQGSEVFG